ncbi:MAG: PAS domain-containing sensor histidine kinase [Candidatus Chisholmbacteria bacterium]|nr:PAS domain-containing sensor histidine kinase [Candidatus Chisholmbacteria bacterium]
MNMPWPDAAKVSQKKLISLLETWRTSTTYLTLAAVRYIVAIALVTAIFYLTAPSSELTSILHLFGLIGALVFITPLLGIGPVAAATLATIILSYLHPHPGITISLRTYQDTSLLLGSVGVTLILLQLIRNKHTGYIKIREKHLNALLERSLHPIILSNQAGQIQYASTSITPLLGLKPHEFIGKKVIDFVHPDDKTKAQDFYKEIFSYPYQRKSTELRLKAKPQSWIWIRHAAINLLPHPHIGMVVASFQDISKQKYLDNLRLESLKREKKARTLAEKAVRARDEFLSVASHELKTPLTTILLHLQGTLRRIQTQSLANFSGERLVQSLAIAQAQSQRLSLMIKDLLNVSLITTGRIELEKKPTELNQLVGHLVERFSEEAKRSGSKLQTKLTGEIHGLWDAIRIEQLLANLLTNALKYGNKKPIAIATATQGQEAIVWVKDQGIGISPKDQAKIFDLFVRGENQNHEPGLGVGLFIASRIASSHNGELKVESQPGQGSTFILKLPLGKQ